jgi:hypothetical protein
MDKRFEEIYNTEKVYIFNILSFLTIYCRHIIDNLFFGVGHKNVQVGSGSVINWPSGPGHVIQNYGTAGPDPREIFTDPHHWVPYR